MDLQKLGKNIKMLREKRNMTQSELADTLFVSFQAVSSWERGLTSPDFENAVRLAEIFGVTVDSLLHDTEAELLVGVDGGGSKTEFLLFQSDGVVLNRILTEGSNPNDRKHLNVADVLEDGLKQLMRESRPKQIFAGVAGTSVGNLREKIENDLRKRFQLPVSVASDAVNILAMAKERNKAGAVICGTGSVVYIEKEKQRVRIGGWGHLFDMAGSAYDVGRDAIRLALAVYDQMEPPCLLTTLVQERIQGDLIDNIPVFYAKGRSTIATYAELVVQAAKENDAKAIDILNRNAQYLAKLLRLAKEKYGIADFLAAGGFFKNQIYREMVESACGFALHYPEEPPVYGACIEAMNRAGIPIDEHFRDNFMRSYRRITC